MNTDYIKTFLAVYRSGSFVEVAKDQNLAPSSVSLSISALENLLKTRLFQRTTRNLTPTRAGEIYFERIAPLIEEMDLTHQSLIDAAATPSGPLRVTASVTYGQVVIAPRLKLFRERYPNIDVELLLSDGQVDLVNGQVDIAIRHGNLPDSTLVARKLADVNYRLVSSKTYLEQNEIPKSPDELRQHELVTFVYDNFRYAWVFEANGDTCTLPIKPALTISSAAAIRQCVINGAGISLLADWMIEEDLRKGRLVELLPDWKVSGASSDSAIWLVYPSSRFIPAKSKAFANFLLN